MAKKIAEMNQKGGVAKTTSLRNMGQALSMEGKKTLMVDFDSQVNITLCCGYEAEDLSNFKITIADLMEKAINDEDVSTLTKESIINVSENLDLIPGAVALAAIEMQLPSAMNRNEALKNIIRAVEDNYDYILVDCGPSLGLLAINALAAVDHVMIPCEPELLSMMGVDLVLDTIVRVRKRINKNLKIEGILITKVDRRLKSSRENMKIIKERYGNHIRVFETYIPERVAVKESKAEHTSVIEYSPKSDASLAYIKVVEEMLNEQR